MGKMNNQKTPGSIASVTVTGADRLRHTGWCGATISSKALCGTLLMNPPRVLLENKKAIELNKPLIASATTSTGTRHLNKGARDAKTWAHEALNAAACRSAAYLLVNHNPRGKLSDATSAWESPLTGFRWLRKLR
jgi:hypothetical protein